MAGMNFRRIATEGGAILYDPGCVNNAPQLFDPDAWRARGALREQQGGRGSVLFLDAGDRQFVLRRYLRGGLPARISRDRYLFLGEDRTRGFAELALLGRLVDAGLPAPAPAAARYERSGLLYRAAIVTLRLPPCESLAARLLSGSLDPAVWQAIGRTIRRFHDAGVQHADLNAHNVMLGESGEVWLLDFDRGRLRPPGDWPRAVLARLERSLAKVCRGRTDLDWRAGFARLAAAHGAAGRG
jgi:3-deoxy-D-manno-octulosonic acid kinase